MTQRQIFAAGFFVVLLVLLYQIALIFRPFLFPVLWAVILAHVMYPLHRRLAGNLGDRETVSAGILTLAIIGLGVVPVTLLAMLLIQEASAAYLEAKAWAASGGLQDLPGTIAHLPVVGALATPVLDHMVITHGDLESFLLRNVQAFSGFLVEELTALAANTLWLTVNLLVMIITLFFLIKDGARLFRNAYDIIPLDETHKEKILSRLDVTVKAVVKGVIITAIVQGLLAGAAYAALGVPFPVVLMALTMVLAPLPFGGTALVWLPVAVYLYWVGPLWKAIAMIVWGAGVVTMVDNLLRPFLIGKGAQLPVLFLFFSMIGGLAAYGMIGVFLGPILLAILLTAIQIYREEYQYPPPRTPA